VGAYPGPRQDDAHARLAGGADCLFGGTALDDVLVSVLIVLLPALLMYALWQDQPDGAERTEPRVSAWVLLVAGFSLGAVCVAAGIRSVARENYISAVTFFACGAWLLVRGALSLREALRQLAP
jgi:hypothetical protein